MTTKRITSGWRGLSTAKQADINTSATVDTAFNFEGDPTDIEVNERRDNADEITGLNEPDTDEILNWKLDGSHIQRVLPHNIGQFIGMVLGKVTDDQPDVTNNSAVYRHWFERDVVNVNLPLFTLIENDGIATKQYKSIFGRTLKISGERNDFIKMEAGFGGMGQEESSGEGKPTVVAESYLRYGDAVFTRGGSLSGTVAEGTLAVGGGPTAFKVDLRSFEYSVDNQAIPIYEIGDNSGFVTRVERGDRFVHSLSAVFEMQDDSHKTGLLNGTTYVLNIPIIGAAITGTGTDGTLKYTVDLIFPKVVYEEAKKSRDGEMMIVNANFKVLEDSTFGSVIVKVINKQTAYLT